jgi:hypothetical protein
VIICPKCGAENGKRIKNPVKCCRCWYQFVRTGKVGVNDDGRNGRTDDRLLRSDRVATQSVSEGQTGHQGDVLLPKRTSTGLPGINGGKTTTGIGSKKGRPERLAGKAESAERGKMPVLLEDGKEPVEPSEDEPLMKLCRACEAACTINNGFWVCPDLNGCGLGGQQQGKVE